MTALNCLARNATTYVIHGNSLSLETHGGYHVRRSPVGGELYPLTREQTDSLIRMPFNASPETTTTALTPTPAAPIVRELTHEAKAAPDNLANRFPVNQRGQGDFGF
jgi:hypothetical protein